MDTAGAVEAKVGPSPRLFLSSTWGKEASAQLLCLRGVSFRGIVDNVETLTVQVGSRSELFLSNTRHANAQLLCLRGGCGGYR